MSDVNTTNSAENGVANQPPASAQKTSSPHEEQRARRPGVRVTIAKDKLSAMLILKRPESGEDAYTRSDVDVVLAEAGVVYGINDEAIERALASGQYDTPVRIAEGEAPRKGEDAAIEYTFETEHELAPEETAEGTIDYRNMNFIQNTVAGSVLATRTVASKGIPGKGVDGNEVAAPNGRDREFTKGENTEISEDGLELRAKVDGAIVYRNGKVSVKDVVVIQGNVDYSVGNLNAVGSVKVNGDVNAGFTITCGGDLEVAGNVEDSSLDVKGNILIKGGCYGKGKGSMLIKADGSVFLKYAEGQNVKAGLSVVVANELINCEVEAGDKVVVEDGRGKIIGGRVSAGNEIRAATFGSEAGTKTILLVAQDKELIERYRAVTEEMERIKNDKERIQGILIGLRRLQIDNRLPADKEEALQKLEDFNENAPKELERCEAKLAEINEEMKRYKDARIIVGNRIYPGVQAHFGGVYRDVTEERTCCILKLEGNRVAITPFQRD